MKYIFPVVLVIISIFLLGTFAYGIIFQELAVAAVMPFFLIYIGVGMLFTGVVAGYMITRDKYKDSIGEYVSILMFMYPIVIIMVIVSELILHYEKKKK